MKVKAILRTLVILVLASVSLIQFGMTKVGGQETTATVFVDPPTIKASSIGETFTINIYISNVVDLYAWQAGVTFNGEVLNCTEVYEGEFLNRGGNTIFVESWRDVDNTTGIIYFRGDCLVGAQSGVNGNGQLFYATFETVGIGISDFHLTDIILIDSALGDIEFEISEAFTIPSGEVTYSVGITNNLTGIDNPSDPPASGSFNHTFIQQDKEISFNTLSPYGSHYKIAVPKALLQGNSLSEWMVKVDEAPISIVAIEDDGYTHLYFEFGEGNHSVGITVKSAESPESPWWQTQFWTIIQVVVAVGGLILGILTYLIKKEGRN